MISTYECMRKDIKDSRQLLNNLLDGPVLFNYSKRMKLE